MKKIISLFMVLTIILTSMPLITSAETNAYKTFYVSTNGNDSNNGQSRDMAFKTLKRAQEEVRKYNAEMTGDIVVNVLDGTYFLDAPLDFTEKDSGFNGHSVIWQGEGRPTISGGRQISGFVPSKDYPGIYELKVENIERIWNMYVNGEKRYYAKSEYMIKGVKKPASLDTDAYYQANTGAAKDSYSFYDPKTPFGRDGMYISKEDIAPYENIEDVFCYWNLNWETHILPIESVEENPYDDSNYIVRMKNGLFDLAVARNVVDKRYPRPEKYFQLCNAMELLDSPGELYYNRKTQMLYYMPTADENLEQAEIIIPELERIMFVNGSNRHSAVKNLTFKGFTMAHTAWYNLANGIVAEQGTNNFGYGLGNPNWSPGSITMEFTDNVTFTDNHFFGLAGIAVDALNGVVNSSIVGNAFSDIGEAAIAMGNMNHLTGHIDENGKEQFSGGNGIGEDGISDAPPSADLDMCISNALGTTWDTSSIAPISQNSDAERMEPDTYYLVRQTASTGGQLSSPSWETDYTYSSNHTWHSAYDAVDKGEKSWVKLDFQKPYTISKVALMFCTSIISKEERKGYEILLSNDKFFSEGNYVVAATQKLTAKALQEYTINVEGKYRYLMLRTIDSTPLALNRISVFTSDRKAHETFVRCKNNKVNNNYITRVGTELQRSGGIVMYYVEDVEVKHNHIYDVNYSGIEVGWGWLNERYGTYNVDIDNNYIEHTVKKAMDGGAIYTLSAMPDSSVSYNHVIDTGVGIHALYPDSGSRFINWIDNVAEDQRGGYTPYNDTIIDNVFKGYATHSRNTLSSNAKTNNEITEMKLFAAGQPQREAYKIVSEAGLEPEYEYLLDIPTKGQAIEELEELVDYIHNFDYWPGLSVHYTDADAEAKNMHNLGEYGAGLGMYKPEMKPYMEEELSYWNAENNNIKLKNLMRIKQAMRNVKDSMQRLSVDETIALFEKDIKAIEDGFAAGKSENDFGMTAKNNLENAKSVLTELKAKEITDGGIEYDVLTALESAYNSFKAKCNDAEIIGVYSRDALSTEIDSESNTVKLIYPYGTDLSQVSLKLYAGLGSEITTSIGSTVNLNQPYKVSVKAVSSGNVKSWTISATQEVNTYAGANGDSFVLPTRYKNRIAATQNNSVILRGNPYAYMTDAYSLPDSGCSLKFKPVTPNNEYEFSVIFGVGNISRFDVDGKTADSNHFQLSFSESGTELYAVENGNKTLISQSVEKADPNAVNTMLYSVNGNKIEVTLNNEKIFSEVTQYTPNGTNMGIYSPKICVEVFNDFEETEITNPVSAVTPSNGATNVTNVMNADNANYVKLIQIEFAKKMDTTTLNQDSIVVMRGNAAIEYTPVINDGSVYAIDPADLVNSKVKGGSARAAYSGVNWNDFANQTYTITLKNTARLMGGALATTEDLPITSFKTLYFADVPYEKGKCIENVGTKATISTVATSGFNKAPQTLLANPDMPYNDGGAYSILNPNKNLKELATITLDKAYDVAGIMLRTRYGFSSAPSWNGVTFKVGDTKENSVALLYTGFGGSNDTALNNTCVLSNSVDGFDNAISGQSVYMSMEAAQLFFPNKIWIFAYTDDYTKTPAFGYRGFGATGTLNEGFSAEVETDGAEPGLVAAIYDSLGRLVDMKSGTWDSSAKKSVVNMSGNNTATSLRVFLWESIAKMTPVAETLTENDLVQTE